VEGLEVKKKMAKECINWNQDWLRHLIKKHLKEDLIEILFLPIYNVHPVFLQY